MALYSKGRRQVIGNRYPPEVLNPWQIDHNSKIVVIGDSISASTWFFWQATRDAKNTECAAKHSGSTPTWTNSAVGSTYSWSFLGTQATDTTPYNPTHLILELGTNNVNSAATFPAYMTNYQSDMRQIIAERRAVFPSLKVLLVVPWVKPYGAGHEVNLATCRDACRLIAGDTANVHLLDWMTFFLGRNDLCADGDVHPSAAGKAEMCKWLSLQFEVV